MGDIYELEIETVTIEEDSLNEDIAFIVQLNETLGIMPEEYLLA